MGNGHFDMRFFTIYRFSREARKTANHEITALPKANQSIRERIIGE
jgi:hypothetical protein